MLDLHQRFPLRTGVAYNFLSAINLGRRISFAAGSNTIGKDPLSRFPTTDRNTAMGLRSYCLRPITSSTNLASQGGDQTRVPLGASLTGSHQSEPQI